jgi:hypothetical protein
MSRDVILGRQRWYLELELERDRRNAALIQKLARWLGWSERV